MLVDQSIKNPLKIVRRVLLRLPAKKDDGNVIVDGYNHDEDEEWAERLPFSK